MKLIIPQTGFSLKTEPDRIIIEFNRAAKNDRPLSRGEVAKRINRSERMVDVYRRLPKEARLRSEHIDGQVVIWESELKRWVEAVKLERGFYTKNGDGDPGRVRPRQKRRSSMEDLKRDLSGLTLT
jgi:hypothetical protein